MTCCVTAGRLVTLRVFHCSIVRRADRRCSPLPQPGLPGTNLGSGPWPLCPVWPPRPQRSRRAGCNRFIPAAETARGRLWESGQRRGADRFLTDTRMPPENNNHNAVCGWQPTMSRLSQCDSKCDKTGWIKVTFVSVAHKKEPFAAS